MGGVEFGAFVVQLPDAEVDKTAIALPAEHVLSILP